MTRLVAVSELETRMGVTFDATDSARAGAALDDASALVLSEGGASWTDVDVPDVVATVVLSAARRGFENPSGLTSEQIGSYSFQVAAGSASGVFLTKDEAKVVRRVSGRRNVGSMQVIRPYLHEADGLVDVDTMTWDDGTPW